VQLGAAEALARQLHPAAALGALLVGLLGLRAWLAAPWTLGPTLSTLAPLALNAALEHLVDGPGVQHGKHMPSALLLCGLLGARLDHADPARGAREAAWGAAAGTYLLAGLAKLLANGAGWLDPQAHALLLLERGLSAPGWLAAPRLFVAARPPLAAALAAGALLIELAGPLLLLRRARAPMVGLIALMHVGIALLMGYVYLPWVACLAALLWVDRAVGAEGRAAQAERGPPAEGQRPPV
jgi:hypothetical protein